MRRKAIWAIARNTIAQALRIRVAFVIMALYIVLVPLLPVFVRGDGTLRGLLHVVIAYSMIVAGGLLGILTLALATTSLWSELRDKQVYLLEARPIRRWQIICGKLLGIMVINAGLLLFMGIVTWGSVQVLVRQRRWDEKGASDKPLWQHIERRLALKQVLVARRIVPPKPPPQEEIDRFLKATLDARCRELERRGKMPPGGREEVKKQLVEEYHKVVNAVGPMMGRRWEFVGLDVPRRPDVTLTLRFKYNSSDTRSLEPDHIRWEFGAVRTDQKPDERPRIYRYDTTSTPDETHEIEFPADAVDGKGRLEVRFYNFEPRQPTLVFPEDEGIAVLMPVGSFAGNLARGMLIVFFEVFFVAALGLFCSSFLTFPVSPIVALSILLLVFLSSFVTTAFEEGLEFDRTGKSKVAAAAEKFTRAVAYATSRIMPPFSRYRPSDRVSYGEEVSWPTVGEAAAVIGVLYGGALTLLSILVFERRELALAQR